MKSIAFSLFFSCCFLISLMGFAQKTPQEIVENAVLKINVVLANTILKEADKKPLPANTNSTAKVLKHLKEQLPDEQNVYQSVQKLLEEGKKYTQDDDNNVKAYLNDILEENVNFEYDKKTINKIIEDAEKKAKKLLSVNNTLENNENQPDNPTKELEELKKQKETSEKNLKDANTKVEKLNSEVITLTKKIEKLEKEQSNGNGSGIADFLLSTLIILLILICICVFAFYAWQKYKTPTQEYETTAKSRSKSNTYSTATVNTIATNTISQSQKVNENKKVEIKEVKPENKSLTKQVNPTELQKNWVVVGASTIGKSHLQSNPPIPCQDNHHYQTIGNGWGVAVSCDGAGSAVNSHFGSKFVAGEASKLFKHIVETNEWHKQQSLPTQDKLHLVSKKAFAKLRYDLGEYAKEKGFVVETLACTVIVVIYSPIGILVTHIGDGRAAFCDMNQNWKPIITPHKGEEANQTLFLTSQIGLGDEKDFVLNGITVPESRVINETPLAFTLMSDGCENHSFELGYFDAEAQKYVEQNNPSPKFFNPLVEVLKELHQKNVSQDEIKAKWEKFVESGNTKLANEADDKTLILGVVIN